MWTSRIPTRQIAAVAVVVLAVLSWGSASADWMGRYFNCILGTTWTYEDLLNPGSTFTESVFDYFEYEGHTAVRLGESWDDHNIVQNTGRIVTVYAQVHDGILTDFTEDFTLGEFFDGDSFSFCPSGVDCDSSLIRVWTELDPTLRAIYNIPSEETDLVLFASYDRDYSPNLQNMIIESNLPTGVEPPAGAVTGIEFYRLHTGTYGIMDIDAASGGIVENLRLITYATPVPEVEPALQPVILEPNYPNPFNPITTICYELRRPLPVSLAVYDCVGHRLATLCEGDPQDVGRHTLQWSGRDDQGTELPSGVYLLRLQTGTTCLSRPVTLVR